MTMRLQRSPIGSPVPSTPPEPDKITHCRARHGVYRRFGKRAFDLAAVLIFAPIVVSIIAVFALAVARDGGSPFYTQLRVGQGGRHFRMWKLRSMVVDADERMKEHLESDPEASVEWAETQKLKKDPRITRVGQFLRKSSLDELPQLWNVFVGDMSLVGPRPIMISQQAIYPSTAYYALRPGITGYWQIAGRNRTSFAARAEFDATYYEDLSLGTDLRVLVRTVFTVLACTGY